MRSSWLAPKLSSRFWIPPEYAEDESATANVAIDTITIVVHL
jgi:hypothetical protein